MHDRGTVSWLHSLHRSLIANQVELKSAPLEGAVWVAMVAHLTVGLNATLRNLLRKFGDSFLNAIKRHMKRLWSD
jgi:hypothetical protein